MATPEITDTKITDVNKSLTRYMFSRKKIQMLIFLVATLVFWIVGILLFLPSFKAYALGFILIIAPPITVYLWMGSLRKQFQNVFLQEFARNNGYQYVVDKGIDQRYGSLFRLNGLASLVNTVVGTYEGCSMQLYGYTLITGDGRDRRLHNFTVLQLDLEGALPHIMMVNNGSLFKRYGLIDSTIASNSVKLEGNFNEYFSLYTSKGNELEALQVFTPDVMALLMDEANRCTVEFINNRIYVYIRGNVSTTAVITQVFALAKQLIAKVAPDAKSLARDSAIVAAHDNL